MQEDEDQLQVPAEEVKEDQVASVSPDEQAQNQASAYENMVGLFTDFNNFLKSYLFLTTSRSHRVSFIVCVFLSYHLYINFIFTFK